MGEILPYCSEVIGESGHAVAVYRRLILQASTA
jgi:hypothetical protein